MSRRKSIIESDPIETPDDERNAVRRNSPITIVFRELGVEKRRTFEEPITADEFEKTLKTQDGQYRATFLRRE